MSNNDPNQPPGQGQGQGQGQPDQPTQANQPYGGYQQPTQPYGAPDYGQSQQQQGYTQPMAPQGGYQPPQGGYQPPQGGYQQPGQVPPGYQQVPPGYQNYPPQQQQGYQYPAQAPMQTNVNTRKGFPVWGIILIVLVVLCLLGVGGTLLAVNQGLRMASNAANDFLGTATVVAGQYEQTATAYDREYSLTATVAAGEASDLTDSLNATATAIAESLGDTGTGIDITPSDTPLPDTVPTPITGDTSTSSGSSGAVTSGGGIGSTGETDGLKITLNSVRHASSGLVDPKPGNEYIVVNLTFENTTSDKKVVSSLLNFTLTDDKGQKYNIEIFGPELKESADGEVRAGEKLTGESAFEIPKDATGLKFVFSPLLGGGDVSFDLDR